MRTSYAIGRYAALLWILLSLAIAVNCAVLSDEISLEALPQMPFGELIQTAGKNQDQMVIVGGYILSVENQERQTQVLAVQAPLGVGQQPKSKDLSQGRLVLIYDGFIDPEVYTKDRQITIGGRIMGSSSTEKHQHPYPYLRVHVEQIHLWPEPQPVYSDPFWDDDCYAYPYSWWRHRHHPRCW